jgi:CRISPR-associated endonuclease/helicase Cas3
VTSFPSFPEFYRAVNERDPFPWQARLAEKVVGQRWPSTIGVPTGLGKSGCIDIAVWSLASQATLGPRGRRLPTRIWYVVNRRLLIDAAHAHGDVLRVLLADPPNGEPAIAAVGEALSSIRAAGSEHGPLHITRLRGGAELGARPPDPSQPALIFATAPMFASRWLFRGYGSSRSMRPVDAALAGIDSLVLLDEAHLSRPLVALARPLEECDLGDPSSVLPADRSRPRIVALTATADVDDDTFDLGPDDHAHPVVRQRLDAPKPVALVETTEKKIDLTLAERAVSLVAEQQQAMTCVVFTNTPRRARAVWKAIHGKQKDLAREVDLVLATGRMRDREADLSRERLLDPGRGALAGRHRSVPRERDLIVVATQTLEVGADLDFDLFVTETPGTRSLVQRLGRLNRMGENLASAGVVCHPSDVKDGKWPVYGEEPAQVWARLNVAALDDVVDLGPSNVNLVLGAPSDAPPCAGELLPVHLWEWAKTTLPPPGEAPVDLFFQGFDEQDRGRVSICWRAHRPEDGARLFPNITEAESVDIPVGEIWAVLQERGIEEVKRLASDRASLETVPADSIAPGDHVVLAVTDGLYDKYGWNPEAVERVLDVSLLRAHVLPLTSEALRALCGSGMAELADSATLNEGGSGDEPLEPDEEQALAAELLKSLQVSEHHPWLEDDEWAEYLNSLSTRVERAIDDAPYLAAKQGSGRPTFATVGVRADAFEELSFDIGSKTLADHLSGVGQMARRMAEAVGCEQDLVTAVEMAGKLHDIGKADARFQRWLDPKGTPDELVAKSDVPRHRIEATRVASEWPKGGRHELLSGRLINRWVEEGPPFDCDPDLLVHLVLTHHGQGRPTLRIVADESPLDLEWEFDGFRATVPRVLSEHDWDQPRRFREMCARYGYWGVALLEACVRQADQAVSGARGVI